MIEVPRGEQMEVGELVSVAADAFGKGDCPFCQEQPTEKKEVIDLEEDTSEDTNDPDIADDGSYRLRNDSGKLARAMGGHPQWLVKLTLSKIDERILIDSEYFRARYVENKSGKIYLDSVACANAHHLIPGNDSLGRATALLKWMADQVNWKRVKYKETPAELSPSMKKSLRRGSTVITVSQDTEGNVDIIQRVETSPGRIKEEQTKKITGRVTGKIEWDVNHNANGMWLPGNNAVVKWGKTDPSLQDGYVKSAIEATKSGSSYRQFHDAHKGYSSEVRTELNQIAQDIAVVAAKCLAEPSHSSGNSEPLPAPKRLLRALNAVARKLREPLSGAKSAWKRPWITSDRSLKA